MYAMKTGHGVYAVNDPAGKINVRSYFSIIANTNSYIFS